MPTRSTVLMIIGVIVAIQLFDIWVHVATGQAEPLCILSNLLLGGWAVACVAAMSPRSFGHYAVLGYLGLNIAFLAIHGLTNPEQGDALRVPLFVFVGSSAFLALWLVFRSKAQ